MAQAECTTAGCATYETEIPHPPVESKPSTHTPSKGGASGGGSDKSGGDQGGNSPNNAKAEGSGGAQTPESSGKGQSGSESENQESSGGVSPGGNNNPPNNGGGEGGNSPGKATGGANPNSQDNISQGQALTKGTPASESSGSSPLVPILIAIAVLAAISIGVVLYRQRKSGQGPDGHADGRMSSSNAS